MPDYPRHDLIGVTATVSCNITPGCTPGTPCPTCQEIMDGPGDEPGECAICVPGQCPGPQCPGWLLDGPGDDDGHNDGCDGAWITDFDGSSVSTCACPGKPCEDGDFETGPASDPYGTGCELTYGDHRAQVLAGFRREHLAVNPLPGPGAEPQYIVWTGGGYAAGDPLPKRDVRYLDADESAALRELDGPVAQ